MKGGVTRKVEQTVKALEAKQLKKALTLTADHPKLERHHQWVVEAARVCLDNKDKPEVCDSAIESARDKVVKTTELPIDSTDLEGLEDYMTETPEEPQESKTDEELYENCPECHVADAVVKFHSIAEGCGDVETMADIDKHLENEMTPPEDWLRAMVEIAEQPTCGQKGYQGVLGELTDYLEKRDSPILKKLDEEEGNA